jgi:biotin synthase
MKLKNIIAKAGDCHNLSKEEIVFLLNLAGEEEKMLLAAADEVRKRFLGSDVHLRGLMEFSNICKNNCLYCGLRKDNDQIKRYRLTEDEIIDLAQKAVFYGFKTIVMQSGEDEYYTVERMKYIISNIKKMDVALTLSMGEKSFEEYEAYRKAGADRYLIRIETTDKDLYHLLDPGMDWNNRYRCHLDLKKLGYELGSGIMVGLPGQRIESIADDLLFLKNLEVDMAGIGPFIPHPETPLKDAKGKEFDLSLRTMAVMRLLLPDINIPATSAMESLCPNGRIMAIKSGANVVMPNITEGEYRRLYELYPGKICIDDTPLHCKTCIGIKIAAIGRTIGTDYGGHNRESYNRE